MKKLFKITAFLNLSILYCLFVSFSTGNDLNNNAEISKHPGSEYCSAEFSSNLFCHTEQSESSISNYNNFHRTTLKNNFNQFSSGSIASEQLPLRSFSIYNFYSKNLPIQFKKTDIIFPFHYFW